MSVLIKGMEMPLNCYQCRFALSRYDTLPTQKYERHDFECVLTGKVLTSTKRNRACPLVEVLTPHGRLIDADELLAHVVPKNPDAEFHCVAVRDIENAPTVIEAEEVKE